MKRVEVLESFGGPDYSVSVGDILDWPDERADYFIKRGLLKLIEDLNPKPKPEKKAAKSKKK